MKTDWSGLVLCAAFLMTGIAAAAESSAIMSGPGRPLVVTLLPDGATALVARQRTGMLTAVNVSTGHIDWHCEFPGTIAAATFVPPHHVALALGGDSPRVALVDSRTPTSTPAGQTTLQQAPTSLQASADGRRLAIAFRDARTVEVLSVASILEDLPDASPRLRIELPFSPGVALWLPDHTHLLVADAFAGRLAVIDASTGSLDSVRDIPAHNISGLALHPSGERVYLTHQAIHSGSQTNFDGVHWGGILTNILRSLAVSDLLDAKADILAHNVTVHLGDIGRAAGDPSAVAIRPDGVAVVTFAGVNDVAFDDGLGFQWQRVTVGGRPTSLALTPDGERAVVANWLDDSLSIVRLRDAGSLERAIPLSPPRELSAIERGERLFFDARLSHDGWMSCHSCHTDGHSNGQLVDNFTDGTQYTPKRVLSLRGVGDTAPYAWDGHMATLADQVRHSVTSTMQGDPLSDSQVEDLVAYLESLPPISAGPAPESHHALQARGREIFAAQGCARCHASPTFTTPATYDVGLRDEQGHRRFNPPSLRNVKHGGPFFHDGRAPHLRDVFTTHGHQLTTPLTDADVEALVTFLNSL